MDYGSNWPEISLARKRLDKFKCVKCSSTDRLEVHHIIPYSRSKDNSMANLQTLCKDHHKDEHRHLTRSYRRRR